MTFKIDWSAPSRSDLDRERHAYHLADAIVLMAARVGLAQAKAAYANARDMQYPEQPEHLIEAARWARTADRRYRALRRLAAALRDLAVAAPEPQKGSRVRVVDPADKRKRVNGTVVRVNEGRGPLEYVVLLDDEAVPMGFTPAEIVGRAREVTR